jgi:uncharacterized membrane protein YwaF
MEVIGSALAVVHAWVATLAAVVAAALVVLGVLDALRLVEARRWLDRLVLLLVATVIVAAILGPGIVIGVRPPSDPLHFLYALVAVMAVPAFRLVAQQRRSDRLGGWLAVGGLVTLGALLRLWATGG